jgi:C4-dicarboxylate-binding protein DctP
MFKQVLKLFLAVAFTVSAMSVQASTIIRVTMQLPESHSLGQNWLAFKKIIEKESGGEL